MNLTLTLAPPEQQELIGNLMQLYLYDFSEFVDDVMDEQGRYIYSYLPAYWAEPTRFPYLVRVDDRPAGFVLVRQLTDQPTWMGIPDDPDPPGEPASGLLPHHSIAEFFIMRRYRRRGAGRLAAFQAFDRHPGRWTVHQLQSNAPAQGFWRRVIAEYTQNHFREINDPAADGPTQYFTNPPRRG